MPSDPAPAVAAPPHRTVDYRRLAWTTQLARDYCHAPDRLTPFFNGAPDDPARIRALAAERRRTRTQHTAVAAIVKRQLAQRRAPQAAQTAASRLGDAATVAIVTGQQAGLFGGPLFTLLKALSAVHLARSTSAADGVPAVPVFWVDAEDHDLAEISDCPILAEDMAVHRISVPYPIDSGTPARDVIFDTSITTAIDDLQHALQVTEFTAPLVDRLRDIYRPGRGPVEAFSRWLDQVLGPSGLVVFDGSDRSAKPLLRDLFRRELDDPGTTARLASTAGQALTALGYHSQVTPRPDSLALFHLGTTRRPIRIESPERGLCRIGEDVVSIGELRDRIAERPETFSPSVLLRPLVQDTLFPTALYVSGPNELAYLAQLREVYRHFGVPMPLVQPRVSATIADRATIRLLDRFNLDLADLQAQDDRVLNRLLASLLPNAVDAAFGSAERDVSRGLADIASEVGAIDPTLVGAVDATGNRMARDLATLRNKVVQAAKRRDSTLRRQFHRASAQTFPGGLPQERALGFVYFLNRHGPDLVDWILADLPVATGRHRVLTV